MKMKLRDRKKFGFDLHGLIDTHEVVRGFMKLLVETGHEVHILTGIPREKAKKKLLALCMHEGIDYTHFYSISDHLNMLGEPSLRKDENGNCWADPREWWERKGLYCRENYIDVIFDNSAMYEPFMPGWTRFVLM